MHPTLAVPTAREVAALVYPSLEELTATLPDEPETHRFLAKVKVGPRQHPTLSPCLLWTAAKEGTGYGIFRGGDWMPRGARLVNAHIWLHMRLHGPVSAGYELDHICHDPELCVVPVRECPHRTCVLHTKVELIAKNRRRTNGPVGRNALKVTCDGIDSPRTADGTLIGHDMSVGSDNVYVTPDGRRMCRLCHRARVARWQAKSGRLTAVARQRGLAEVGQLELIAG